MLFESMVVIAAVLLIMSGGAKIVDAGPTRGALRAAHLPSSKVVVRVLAVTEVLVGAASLTFDHPGPVLALGVLYVGFAGFVGWSMRRGLPIQSCGCFGKTDTPPTAAHVVVNLTLAAAAFLSARRPPLLDRLFESPIETGGVLAFALIGVYLTYLLLTELPATMTAARRVRS